MAEHEWQKSAEAGMRVSLGAWQQLAGGDFAQSWRAQVLSVESCIDLPDTVAEEDSPVLEGTERDAVLYPGASIFIKTHASPPPKHFSTEARGLAWLRDTGAVRVPAVLGVSDEAPYLALQWIEEGSRTSRTESDFGLALAQMHQTSGDVFGRKDERTTGSLGLPNKPGLQWSEFYSTQRLYPLARIAHERNALSGKIVRKVERLADQLGSLFGELDGPPARLHGDLWAGNRLVDCQGQNWLIDPACHGGHREFDLAMMRLFGGYGEACFALYQEHYPLSAGWQERIALHQLAPLIVHSIKFGQAYVGPTEEALDRYV